MAEMLSPLAPVYETGRHGNAANGAGVTLSEVQPGSIVQAAAWPGQDATLRAAIAKLTNAKLPDAPGAGVATKTGAVFGFAPGRYLVVTEQEGLAQRLAEVVSEATGTVTDLSHGRTVLRVAGPRAEWVLAKLFAIDFSAKAFPVGKAISTNHHEIFAQIQRSDTDQFDLYVFRSFARSFWQTLCHAADEVGYEVA